TETPRGSPSACFETVSLRVETARVSQQRLRSQPAKARAAVAGPAAVAAAPSPLPIQAAEIRPRPLSSAAAARAARTGSLHDELASRRQAAEGHGSNYCTVKVTSSITNDVASDESS